MGALRPAISEVVQFLVDCQLLPPERAQILMSWKHSGFNVHAGDRVSPEAHAELEELAQYILRNPFSVQKMTLESPDDTAIYRSPKQTGGCRPEAVGSVPMRDHTKLRAFQLADQVALAIYSETRSFPRQETFGLTSQLRRGAVSIASNIVEGAARSSQADYVHFLDMAYGSAREVEYQVGLAFRLGLLSDQSHRELSALTVETSKVLNGLLRSLRGQ